MAKMKRIILFLLLFGFPGLRLSSAQSKTAALTFNHAAVCVKDLGVSTNFYKAVLGLEEIPNPFNDGIHAWFKIGPQLQLHVIQRGCSLKPEKNVHLCFSTASLQDFVSGLEKARVSYTNLKGEGKEPTTRVDGIKQIYLQDPDGYWIEINDAK